MPLKTIVETASLLIIYVACAVWAFWWLLSNESLAQDLDRKLSTIPKSRFFRTDATYGSAFIYQAAPFIVVAFLSCVVIELRSRRRNGFKAQEHGDVQKKQQRARPQPSVLTYPLLVKSPLGIVTVAEVLFIMGILLVIMVSYGRMTYLHFKELDAKYMSQPQSFTKVSLNMQKLAKASRGFGKVALIPFSLLWVPVSRGSPFLRLIQLPFEHAVKYHKWLATMMLAMLAIHGTGFMAFYVMTNQPYKIIMWVKEGEECAVVAGVVALIAGLTMWATSLSFFRRRCYELFFGVHHLYIVFFVFWLYHMVATMHFFIVPVMVFMVDRFIRMVQSRPFVDVLSARVLQSGAVELKLATRDDQEYNALSIWRLRLPSLSKFFKFEWHFFSSTSSPCDEKPGLSIVIKPIGGWTNNLKDQILKSATAANYNVESEAAKCPFSFKAHVEGPYGDEKDFYLSYSSLVLVGGGIGVTPLLAILRDILNRARLRERLGLEGLPTSIQVFHSVRKPEELCVLNDLNPNLILPSSTDLSIRVHVYVTSAKASDYAACMSEAYAAAESGAVVLDLATYGATPGSGRALKRAIAIPAGVSAINSKGPAAWVMLVAAASLAGFYLLWGLNNVTFIRRADNASFYNYNRVHVILMSMVLSTAFFGGSIVALWMLTGRRSVKPPSSRIGSVASPLPPVGSALAEWHAETEDLEDNGPAQCPWNGTLHLRGRPRWQDIFAELAKEYAGQNVGVLVSGVQGMQEDVARECRRHTNIFDSTSSAAVFHYHSVSFEL